MTRSESGAVASDADAPGTAAGAAAAIDFALFASGAPFSCAVLRALRRLGCRPRQIVLPTYPPAAEPADRIELQAVEGRGEFAALAEDTAVDHAPATEQAHFAARFATREIDFILVACWPYLIGEPLIRAARKAALNLHPSLLPAWRGPDPLGDQLAAADPDFGVSLHLLDPAFDHGDIVAQAAVDAGEDLDRATLERRCAERGAGLFVAAAASFDAGWSPRRQDARR